MKVTIYSDGGADPNPGIGGWAAILRAGGREKVLSGSDPHTTNNRMELEAAIAALRALKRRSEVEFHTDSEYLRKGITEWIDKWAEADWRRKGKPIPNADLWQALWTLVKEHDVEWHWVKGHAGDALNERVDRLARQARLAITPADRPAGDLPRLYVRATCKGNPGPGAWGVVLERDGETEQTSGSVQQTTNNRMELMAVLEGLKLVEPGSAVQVITMSDYVYQGATKWIHGWRRRDWKKRGGGPVSNQDLWKELDRLSERYQVHWLNAKGEPEMDSAGLHEAALIAAEALPSA